MYAVVEVSGRQFRVEPGAKVVVNRVTTAVGKTHTLKHVLLASDGKQLKVGKPFCSGASVLCEVLAHPRGPKTISYKFRRRENFRRTRGARQNQTTLLVKAIELGSKE